jgi:hypothetical protein
VPLNEAADHFVAPLTDNQPLSIHAVENSGPDSRVRILFAENDFLAGNERENLCL